MNATGLTMNRATMTAHLLGEASGPLAGIYVVTHRATGKRYVGQSLDIARRWAEHRAWTSGSRRLTNALKKHGPDAFTFEIVELCAREELNDRERFYISAFGFDCLSPRGYNLTAGGEGGPMTEEVRARHAQAVRSSENRARASESAKNSEACRRQRARLHADPELVARRLEASCRVLAKLNADPEFCARRDAANRLRLTDPTTHTLAHTVTGAVEVGNQTELRERLGLRKSGLSALVRGTLKTYHGWRLVWEIS